MSKTTWIWVILIGLVLGGAICIGIRMANSFVKGIEGRKIIHHPPDEYFDLFKGPDAGNLQFMETIVDRNRNPVSRYRYHGKYEILETKLDFSDTGRLAVKLKIVQAEIQPIGFNDSYDALKTGWIDVNFRDLDQPDSSFTKVSLNIEGRGFENGSGNDSVLSYFLEQGYFSISRSPGGVSDIFSAKGDNYGSSGYSTPTVLLFKSRGNSVFILVGSPVREKTEVPQDLLRRLVNDKS
jgi:hypothetical protein